MSERGSFTSQYFYNDRDYEVIRKALDKKGKYLCIAPPATWECTQFDGRHDVFEMPIVQGKVGELSSNLEWMTIADELDGVVTEQEVRIVVMCDGGSIVILEKSPKGIVKEFAIDAFVNCCECQHFEEDPSDRDVGTCLISKRETDREGYCDKGEKKE